MQPAHSHPAMTSPVILMDETCIILMDETCIILMDKPCINPYFSSPSHQVEIRKHTPWQFCHLISKHLLSLRPRIPAVGPATLQCILEDKRVCAHISTRALFGAGETDRDLRGGSRTEGMEERESKRETEIERE
jgi:hypothetical protein